MPNGISHCHIGRALWVMRPVSMTILDPFTVNSLHQAVTLTRAMGNELAVCRKGFGVTETLLLILLLKKKRVAVILVASSPSLPSA
jgi:hypothetical protein